MINYQLGKVYKIVGNDKIYVGSTCERLLCQRLSGHIRAYKSYHNGKSKYTSSFVCITDDNHYIELLEACPCNTKDELHKCERKWIEQLVCVNKFIVGRTQKEYYEEHKEANKEHIKENNTEYRYTHKEQTKEYNKQYRDEHNEQMKEYKQTNKDHINEQQKQRYWKKKQIINQCL